MPTAILVPSANDSVSWTGYTGTNYANIDETSYSDADYNYVQVYAGTSAYDYFVFTDLPSNASGVTSVKLYWRAANSSGGSTGILYSGFRIGSTDYTRISGRLTGSFTTYTDTMTTSPATSSAWTVSEVNSMKGFYRIYGEIDGDGGVVGWMQWEVVYTIGGVRYMFGLS